MQSGAVSTSAGKAPIGSGESKTKIRRGKIGPRVERNEEADGGDGNQEGIDLWSEKDGSTY